MKRDGALGATPHLSIFIHSVLVMVAREVSCKQLLQQLLSRPLWYYQLRFHRRYPILERRLSMEMVIHLDCDVLVAVAVQVAWCKGPTVPNS
jgi:hypothetical protein